MNTHDCRKAVKLSSVPEDSKRRIITFLNAVERSPNDADIDIRIGRTDSEPAILVLCEDTEHALLVSEARMIAGMLEASINTPPENSEDRTLHSVIMDLRVRCDAAERAYRASIETIAMNRLVLAGVGVMSFMMLVIAVAMR
ncbi:hypothetical protein JQ633_01140 [Bradyrhizobium tropiciagri]|uniref:hypothetical protein n=1 Tax=Bradyrhizobium tropiciagri TaxID=312253 RepID=UPI001BAE1349|nr:hypothetical protein [Bradyrhizobium tropiciagri]MBR0868946.1 hypothetical protein [Bradyrhizobium tropiciagri]